MLESLKIFFGITCTDPDFFVSGLFICISLATALKLWYWHTSKPTWAKIADASLDGVIAMIVICCFVQTQIWHICYPVIYYGIWGCLPYGVFCCFYLFRNKWVIVDSNKFHDVADCELEHVHRKLGDLINAMRYVPGEQKLYWDLILFQDQILDEELRRVSSDPEKE